MNARDNSIGSAPRRCSRRRRQERCHGVGGREKEAGEERETNTRERGGNNERGQTMRSERRQRATDVLAHKGKTTESRRALPETPPSRRRYGGTMRDSRANHHRTEAGDGAERKQKESRRRERCEKRAKGFARWRPGERKKDKKERKGFGTERRFKSEPGGRQKKKKDESQREGGEQWPP